LEECVLSLVEKGKAEFSNSVRMTKKSEMGATTTTTAADARRMKRNSPNMPFVKVFATHNDNNNQAAAAAAAAVESIRRSQNTFTKSFCQQCLQATLFSLPF